MSGSIYYVYGALAEPETRAAWPAGIEEGAVELIPGDGISAIATAVDADLYEPSRIEQLTGDMDWVRDRAIAHDRILSFASDLAPVVPFPMWNLFRDVASVRSMLQTRHDELLSVVARVRTAREYTVRVFIRPSVLEQHVSTHDSALADLERQSAAASPGQAYLLGRKMEKARKDATRRAAADVAAQINAALSAASEESVAERTGAAGPASERGYAVLNASFLVDNSRLTEFRRILTTLIGRYSESGFQFDFTGPWPPYHFAGGRADL